MGRRLQKEIGNSRFGQIGWRTVASSPRIENWQILSRLQSPSLSSPFGQNFGPLTLLHILLPHRSVDNPNQPFVGINRVLN